MTLKELQNHFSLELEGKYSTREAERLFFIFLEEVAGLNRLAYLSDTGAALKPAVLRGILEDLKQLKMGVPYQYLLGKVSFAGLQIQVNPDALIPRPETEELAYLIKNNIFLKQPIRIVDIGTGTGCLALACTEFFPGAEVWAIDFSESALALAQANAHYNQKSLTFFQANFLNEQEWPSGEWDIIVSNPPYIAEGERSNMEDLVLDHEPALALFVPDNDPLVFYKAIRRFADKNLNKGGMIFLEINERLGEETLAVFKDYKARLEKDMSGKERFVVATK